MPGPTTLSQAEIDQSFDAWAAGFFDGEGSISVPMHSDGVYYLIVQVSQNRLEPLEALRDHYGGNIQFHSMPSMWTWKTSGFVAIEFLKKIRPWLMVKDKQADIAIEFPMVGSGNKTSEENRLSRKSARENIMQENRRRYDARSYGTVSGRN